jgi:hypothetical protein
MPAEASILGFDNRWQAAGIPYAVERALPSGALIRVLSSPYLLATKVEAFKGRGRGDFLRSRDFGDVIALVDGRRELIGEVAAAEPDVREYLAAEVGGWLEAPRFLDGVYGALLPDSASQERADVVVLPALRAIAGQD